MLLIEPGVDLTAKEVQSASCSDEAYSTSTLQMKQAVICDANEINLNDS